MQALIVGAGVVGQIFGRHLSLGGAKVAFYVRPGHAATIRNGITYYPLSRRTKREFPVIFQSYDVVSSPKDVARRAWDQVYLCVPAPALRTGLLATLSEVVGEATVVTVQPGLGSHRSVLSEFAEERVVFGLITFAGYPGPLPAESLPRPGTCYWFPPLMPSPFSGPAHRVQAVVSTLNDGRLPARTHPDIGPLSAFVVAAQTPWMAGLEKAGWSIRRFRGSYWQHVANEAAKEALTVAAAIHCSKPPLVLGGLLPVTLRVAPFLAPLLYPFDLEAFLALHYTKLKEQSLLLLTAYIKEGQIRMLPTNSLEELRWALGDGNE